MHTGLMAAHVETEGGGGGWANPYREGGRMPKGHATTLDRKGQLPSMNPGLAATLPWKAGLSRHKRPQKSQPHCLTDHRTPHCEPVDFMQACACIRWARRCPGSYRMK